MDTQLKMNTDLYAQFIACLTPPATIPLTISLADLRNLKQTWLEQAIQSGYPQACLKVARELGQPYTLRGRRDYPARLWQHQLPTGNGKPHRVQALWYAHTGTYLGFYTEKGETQPAHHFARYQTVVVTIGAGDWWQGTRVCVYFETNHPKPDTSNHLFVPGRWIEPVLACLAAAEGAILTAVFDDQEKLRRALLAELCIGQEV